MLSLWLGLGIASALPPTPSDAYVPVPRSVQIHDYCFGSGLRVVAQEDHTRPLVAVYTTHEGGTRFDPIGQEGTAHLAEHLWFRSPMQAEGEVIAVRRLHDRWSVVGNAHTLADTVTFESEGPREALPTLLAIEAARLGAPLDVGEAVVESERAIVDNERLLRQPLGFVPFLSRSLFGADDPRARDRASPASIAALDLKGARRFASEHWTPPNTTIVIVGDFVGAELPAMLTGAFAKDQLLDPQTGKLQTACRSRLVDPATPIAPASTEVTSVEAPYDEPHVLIGWTLPSTWTARGADVQLAVALFEARLKDAVRDLPGFGDAACWLERERDLSVASCSIAVGSRVSAKRGFQAAHAVVTALADPGLVNTVGRDLLEEYAQAEQAVLEGLESGDLVTRASRIAGHVHVTGEGGVTRARLVQLGQITTESVVQTIHEYLTADRMVAVLLEPNGGTAESWDEQRALADVPLSERASPPTDEGWLAKAVAAPDLSGVVTKTLPNGLQVVAVRLPGVTTVRTGLLLPGGRWSEPKPGLAFATWVFTQRWYQFGTFDNQRAPWSVKGRWNAVLTEHGPLLSVTSGAGNLDYGLFLVRDLVDHSKILSQFKSTYMRWLRRSAAEVDQYGIVQLDRAVQAKLFPDFGEAAPDIKSLGLGDIRRFHQATWQPRGATLLMVGELDPDAAVKLAGDWFGSWKPAKLAPPATVTPEVGDVGSSMFTSTSRNGSVATVRLHCPVPDTVATATLSAFATAWSWEHLRHERSLVYAASASVGSMAGHPVLVLEAPTESSSVPEVIRGWRSMLEEAVAGIDETSLAYARVDAAESLRPGLSGRDAVFATAAELVRAGQPLSALDEVPQRLAAVTSEQVADVARSCQGREQISVFGPQAAVDAVKADNGG